MILMIKIVLMIVKEEDRDVIVMMMIILMLAKEEDKDISDPDDEDADTGADACKHDPNMHDLAKEVEMIKVRI